MPVPGKNIRGPAPAGIQVLNACGFPLSLTIVRNKSPQPLFFKEGLSMNAKITPFVKGGRALRRGIF